MTYEQARPMARAQVTSDMDATEFTAPRGGFAVMANLAGAAVSVALIAGIGVWGYKLMVRDVSGIPIVRAAEGEMRVLPEDPGGQLARNQGLAVNEIAAEGTASGPVDQVMLAPNPVTLLPDDTPAPAAAPPVVQPQPLGSAEAFIDQAVLRQEVPLAEDTPTSKSEIDALVTEVMAGVPAETKPLDTVAPVAAAETPAQAVLASAPGPRSSIRPRPRPQVSAVHKAAYNPSQQSTTARAEIDAASIPSGTRLAQLGAFDSADVARAEWARLEQRFGTVLADKSRVVQEVNSGGRVFYRLRAMGFRDLGDARRFCSTFKAEGVDCIPVAAR